MRFERDARTFVPALSPRSDFESSNLSPRSFGSDFDSDFESSYDTEYCDFDEERATVPRKALKLLSGGKITSAQFRLLISARGVVPAETVDSAASSSRRSRSRRSSTSSSWCPRRLAGSGTAKTKRSGRSRSRTQSGLDAGPHLVLVVSFAVCLLFAAWEIGLIRGVENRKTRRMFDRGMTAAASSREGHLPQAAHELLPPSHHGGSRTPSIHSRSRSASAPTQPAFVTSADILESINAHRDVKIIEEEEDHDAASLDAHFHSMIQHGVGLVLNEMGDAVVVPASQRVNATHWHGLRKEVVGGWEEEEETGMSLTGGREISAMDADDWD